MCVHEVDVLPCVCMCCVCVTVCVCVQRREPQDYTTLCSNSEVIRKVQVQANITLRHAVQRVVINGNPGSGFSWEQGLADTFKITNLNLPIGPPHSVCFVLRPGYLLQDFCMVQAGAPAGCMVALFSSGPPYCCVGQFAVWA